MANNGSSRAVGVGRVLIAVYAILALAATARSFVQIVGKFDVAPIAYLLSALAGLVYILATVALLRKGDTWYRIAWITIIFELVGVLLVGTLSVIDPVLFPADTVWSFFGRGYLFIPLVLPILGMLWLYRLRPVDTVPSAQS
ncbi:hypothetical protein QMG83_05830 [Salinibacterium sp. G-O1]|uniref:hypothetical protein n=1 Tax=Salinibacterium sp. G-O1 TaxID=3046208 RepID=UPI0024BAA631|nr:hypothetical protein [Salinibacterium sp. G-O1]MDJ0334739.1 hypothetical protein [Salinibacterium sp. G-O1]